MIMFNIFLILILDMMISYNSSQIIKDRFEDWNVAEYDLTYSMRTTGDYMREQKSRKELLLFNYKPTLVSVC